jgi:hypothetical protein
MKVSIYCLVAALLGAAAAWGQAPAAPPGRTEAEEAMEILTRGPVHEAFAETISFDPEPGIVVPKQAPEAIEELPPEQKPEGANVAWIPGYWAWDDERSDFLWVSGIWRALPPGRQWMPGYWGQSQRGSQWVSGYWADAQASEIDYLPEPPQTVEAGPNVEAPSADHTWLPGTWIWHQDRYAWRPGYWASVQPNWVWIPAHYVWAPRGYVYVDGYYDHSTVRRGIVFAPVYFRSNVYSRRGYSYSPVTVINPAVFGSHLFLRPSYGHYYFGDYYGSSYASSGFSPWFSFSTGRSGYDPFFAHQRWHHRSDRGWNRRLEEDFARRRDHEEARPPRTWTAQRQRTSREATSTDESFVMAAGLDEVAGSKESPHRFQPLAAEQRRQIAERGRDVRKVRDERQKLEARAVASADAPAPAARPVKVKLPKTPIAWQSGDRVDRGDAPPKALEAPPADLKIEPKPRKPRGNADSPRGNAESPREPRPAPRETRPDRPKAAKGRSAEPASPRPAAEPVLDKPVRDPAATPPASTDDRPKDAPKTTPKGEGKNKP